MLVFLILMYAIQTLSIRVFFNLFQQFICRSMEFFPPKVSAGTTFLKKRDHNTVNFSVHRNKQNVSIGNGECCQSTTYTKHRAIPNSLTFHKIGALEWRKGFQHATHRWKEKLPKFIRTCHEPLVSYLNQHLAQSCIGRK